MGMHLGLVHVYACNHTAFWFWVCTPGFLPAKKMSKYALFGAKGVRKGCERPFAAKGGCERCAKGTFRTFSKLVVEGEFGAEIFQKWFLCHKNIFAPPGVR